MRLKPIVVVAVVLSLTMTGCVGLLPGSDAVTTPGTDGGAEQPMDQAEGTSTADGAADRQVDFDRPAVEAAGEFGNYTELYDATIDSIVEIRIRTERGESLGSGFVYHPDGYVVTNQHVVSDTESVSVGFASGVWRTGEVVGADVYTDLAVIRVDSLPEGAEPLPLAEGTPVTGQPVAAMGSPLGFEGSITQGIVSGTNRSMPVTGGYSIPDTVQTDAAINPGNSGGPLVSMDGAVLGVNRATAGDNIGFAISAAVVERVVPDLVANGSYPHSFVGVRTIPVTPDVAAANDLDTTGGMMIVDVLEDGPADGVLRPAERGTGPEGQPTYVGGDVIVDVDGREIESQHDLARHLLLHTQPGEEVQVTVLREGERVTETLTLERRPDPAAEGGV